MGLAIILPSIFFFLAYLLAIAKLVAMTLLNLQVQPLIGAGLLHCLYSSQAHSSTFIVFRFHTADWSQQTTLILFSWPPTLNNQRSPVAANGTGFRDNG